MIRPPCRSTGEVSEPGLYSRRGLTERGIVPRRLHSWGGKGRQLGDFICLCFHLPAGILRAEPEAPAVLLIDPDVIAWTDTRFCRTNSARRGITTEEILAWSDLEAFERLFRYEAGPQLRYHQAEILVRDCIPLTFVHEIVLPPTELGRRAVGSIRWEKWRRRFQGRLRFPRVRLAAWQSLL